MQNTCLGKIQHLKHLALRETVQALDLETSGLESCLVLKVVGLQASYLKPVSS